MPHSTQPFSSAALILSSAPGNSRLTMTVARNVRLNGIALTVFGQQPNNMRSWSTKATALRFRPACSTTSTCFGLESTP